MANTKDVIGEQATLDGLIARTLTEFEDDSLNNLPNYAFRNNNALITLTFPNMTTTGNYCFAPCKSLVTINLPNATLIGQSAISGCENLTTLNAPKASSFQQSCLQNCYALLGIETTADQPFFSSSVFNGCRSMTWLKLRGSSKATLSNSGYQFAGTPIELHYGAVYVPSALVSTYKADNNWNKYIIASLDDFPITDFSSITDSWSEILAAEANGTYSTKYAIGDTKKAVINGNDVYMQIAAFDADTLTAGGTAKITWIAKDFYDTHKMNETNTHTDGWAASGMRTWLQSTIYDGLDSTLKSAIKSVDKTYYDPTSDSTKTVSDTLWIPSWREVGFSSQAAYESSGPIYSGLFTNDTSRLKHSLQVMQNAGWWVRSATTASTVGFRLVQSNGTSYNSGATNAYGVIYCFCT